MLRGNLSNKFNRTSDWKGNTTK